MKRGRNTKKEEMARIGLAILQSLDFLNLMCVCVFENKRKEERKKGRKKERKREKLL